MRCVRGVRRIVRKLGTFGGGVKNDPFGGGLFRPFFKGRNFYKKDILFFKNHRGFLRGATVGPLFDPKKGSLFGQFSDFWGPFRGGTPGKVLL